MRKFLSFLFVSAIVCFNVQTISADPVAIDKENPYVNNFDTETLYGIPTGWTKVAGTSYYPSVDSKQDIPTRGSSARALVFQGYNGDGDMILALPEFSDAISYLSLEFYYKTKSSSYPATMSVGYITDLADKSTYTALQTLSYSSDGFTKSTQSFEDAPDGAYIAIFFRGTNSSKKGALYIDDVTVTTSNTGEEEFTCAAPKNFRCISYSMDRATFAWEQGGEETEYESGLAPKGGDVSAWTICMGPEREYTIVGLPANMELDFYLRSICPGSAEGDRSKAVKCTIKTDPVPAPTSLQIVYVTTTGAKLSWTAVEGISAYEYQINDGEWIKINATELELNDLTPNTLYTVNVRSWLGILAESDPISISFRTNCAPIAALPWSEDFEDETTGQIPSCWETFNANESEQAEIKVSTSTTWLSFDGKALLFNGSKDNAYAYIKFPEIAASLTGMQITFSLKAETEGKSGNADFGYTDAEGVFHVLKEYVPTKEMTKVDPCLLNDVDGLLTFRYKGKDTYKYAIAIDDILIEKAPACAIPTELAVSGITDATATLTWTSEASAFKVQYTTDKESWGEEHDAATASYAAEGLNPNTTYYARVKAACDAEDESDWTEEISFTTECAAVDMPFSENFDEADAIPACWKTNGEWSLSEGMLRFNAKSYEAGVLILPVVNISAEDAVLIFRYRNILSNASGFINSSIAIVAASGEVVNIELADASEMTKVQLDLSAFNGKATMISFLVDARQNSTAYFLLDEISVVPQPCEQPKDLQAEVGSELATLSWAAGDDENQWQLRYKQTEAAEWIVATVGEEEEATTILSEKTLTLTDLENEKEYEAQVRAYCDENHQSEWTESVLFTPTQSTGIDDIHSQENIIKRFENGVLYIIRDGVKYNAQGARVY